MQGMTDHESSTRFEISTILQILEHYSSQEIFFKSIQEAEYEELIQNYMQNIASVQNRDLPTEYLNIAAGKKLNNFHLHSDLAHQIKTLVRQATLKRQKHQTSLIKRPFFNLNDKFRSISNRTRSNVLSASHGNISSINSNKKLHPLYRPGSQMNQNKSISKQPTSNGLSFFNVGQKKKFEVIVQPKKFNIFASCDKKKINKTLEAEGTEVEEKPRNVFSNRLVSTPLGFRSKSKFRFKKKTENLNAQHRVNSLGREEPSVKSFALKFGNHAQKIEAIQSVQVSRFKSIMSPTNKNLMFGRKAHDTSIKRKEEEAQKLSDGVSLLTQTKPPKILKMVTLTKDATKNKKAIETTNKFTGFKQFGRVRTQPNGEEHRKEERANPFQKKSQLIPSIPKKRLSGPSNKTERSVTTNDVDIYDNPQSYNFKKKTKLCRLKVATEKKELGSSNRFFKPKSATGKNFLSKGNLDET